MKGEVRAEKRNDAESYIQVGIEVLDGAIYHSFVLLALKILNTQKRFLAAVKTSILQIRGGRINSFNRPSFFCYMLKEDLVRSFKINELTGCRNLQILWQDGS